MNIHQLSLVLAGSLALTCGRAIAQHSPTPGMGDATTGLAADAINNGFVMERATGGLRASGPRYKAELDHAGVACTPALGLSATHNFPFHVQLRRIRRGGVALANLDLDVRPSLQDAVATYARSPDIAETWTARADGLKHEFVFARQPAGVGDLVVECRLTTELVLDSATADSGLVFTTGGLGGIRVGAVTGIDAAGRRVAGQLSFEAGTLRFVLPGPFVENATYPLVLDPLVGPHIVAASTAAADPDVASDESETLYLAVWEERFSALDIDVRGQRFGFAGHPSGNLINVSFEAGNEINPTVASVNLNGRFFVAYQDGGTPFGPWNIRGRYVEASSGARGPIFDVTPTGGDSEMTPDAGGDRTTAGNSAIVTFADSGGGIGAVVVNAQNSTAGATVAIYNGQSLARSPAISKSGGDSRRYAIAWDLEAFGDRNVVMALVDHNLNLLDPLHNIAITTSRNETEPDVDGDGTDFVVVYEREESSGTNVHDIYCRGVRWNGSALVNTVGEVPVGNAPNFDEVEPAIGFLGLKYVVAWVVASDIATIEIDPTNCQACGVRETSSGLGSLFDRRPEIGARYHGGSTGGPNFADDAMIVWADFAATGPLFDGAVLSQRYEAFRGGPVTDLGGACGNGGTNSFSSQIALGNSRLHLILSGASSALVFASIQFADVTQTCGPCTFNSQNSYLFTVASGSGVASYPLAIPCDPSFQNLEIYTQWATFVSGSNPCGLIPTTAEVSFSNRLRGTVRP